MRSGVAREIALVYAFACSVTLLVSHVRAAWARDYGHLVLASAFLGAALWLSRRDGRTARHYGIDLAGLLEASADEPDHPAHGLWYAVRRALPRALTELAFALCVAAIVFPLFVLGFRVFHDVTRPFTLQPPAAIADFVLGQLVVIALPEEALFRGYFQTRLEDVFPARTRLLGATLSPAALACQALLFALLHFLVGFSPARLAVFFPGLLFGWIRARRGGIGAAVWFHAMCNLLAELLTRGYL
ncbi:MAG: myxosortase MrtC [Polyangiales bacterium]